MFQYVWIAPLFILSVIVSFAAAAVGFLWTLILSGFYWGNRWAHLFALKLRGDDPEVLDRTPYIMAENQRLHDALAAELQRQLDEREERDEDERDGNQNT